MILIFEGCDCVGKTSLINMFIANLTEYVKQRTVLKHYKNPPICKNQKQYIQSEYNMQMYQLMEYYKEVNFILDRFYIGEQVYAPIFRKYKPMNFDIIEKELNKMNAIIVYVYADVDDIKKRFDGNFIKKKHIQKILYGYRNFLNKTDIKKIIYINTSELNQYKAFEYLMRQINEFERTV
jgi:thymidylate kinase